MAFLHLYLLKKHHFFHLFLKNLQVYICNQLLHNKVQLLLIQLLYIEVYLYKYIRPEMKFGSLEELKNQISNDKQEVLNFLNSQVK